MVTIGTCDIYRVMKTAHTSSIMLSPQSSYAGHSAGLLQCLYTVEAITTSLISLLQRYRAMSPVHIYVCSIVSIYPLLSQVGREGMGL